MNVRSTSEHVATWYTMMFDYFYYFVIYTLLPLYV
jgi:hypothetical protein